MLLWLYGLWSLCTCRSSTTQNVVPGFAFPTVGRLGFTSPPSRMPKCWHPSVLCSAKTAKSPSRVASGCPSLPDTLPTSVICVSSHTLWVDSLSIQRQQQITPGLLVNRYTSTSGYSTRRQMALPSSQATPLCTCPGLRPRRRPEYSPL